MAGSYSNRNREEDEEEVKDPDERQEQQRRQQQKQKQEQQHDRRHAAKGPPLDLQALALYGLQYLFRNAWVWGRRLVGFFGWWEVGVILVSFLVPWFFRFLLVLATRHLSHIVTDKLPSVLPGATAVAGDGNPSMFKDWLVEGAIGLLPAQAQGLVRRVLEVFKT